CTVATNAMVERKGARTALLATRGHEEAFFIGKASQKVAGLTTSEMTYQTRLEQASPPIVARPDAIPITQRMDREGAVVVALNETEVEDAIKRLAEDGIEAVAVVFLWSFLNDSHEKQVSARLRQALPDVFVSASHEIAPILGEYERATTTVANAYVAPRLIAYMERLEQRLAEKGYGYPLLLAHCMGGLTTMEEIRNRPLLTLDSGPVSGVLGARFFGDIYGEPNIISGDMGGTTFDVALIENGRYILDPEPVIDRYTCAIPKVAVESVGAGGGSIVWVDEDGMLRAGPKSTGAQPGPACYGLGGTVPSVTDVNLLLGYMDDEAVLGGVMKLDRPAAERAMDEVAEKFGRDRIATAAGAFRIVNAHMADLIRRTSIDRGRDPREFVLFAYGGAGALHIAYLARDLGISRIYVPSFATVFSAMGMLVGGILHSAERSCLLQAPLSEAEGDSLSSMMVELEGGLSALFDAEEIELDARRYDRFVHMKYRLQPGSLAVPVSTLPGEEGEPQDLRADFEALYTQIYGPNAAFAQSEVEIVKAQIEGSCATVVPSLAPLSMGDQSDPGAALKTMRQIYFLEAGDFEATPVYDGSLLRPGMKLTGPAIVERVGDSILLPEFTEANVDAYENVIITLQSMDWSNG
ncbi:MAG: hydantoinase/oxoprolinase family protein, partial [Rhodospirillales bacterium]|nr:hydantoinase/oxoprolinase family protein [Rhodospirillales bacterium]